MEHFKRQTILWPTQPSRSERCMIGYIATRGSLNANVVLHARHARSNVDAGWYIWCFRSEDVQNSPTLLHVKAMRKKLRGKDKAASTKVSERWQVGRGTWRRGNAIGLAVHLASKS